MQTKIRFHRVFILICFIYSIFLSVIYFSQEKLIFFPSNKVFLEADLDKLNGEEFRLKPDKKTTIHGYFFTAKEAKKTILFFHGNSGNITNNFARIAIAKNLGLNIAIFDYRGYGQSIGQIKEERDIYADGQEVYDFLVKKKRIPRNSIILWGQSLGGAVATEIASKNEINKLILESTFTGIDEMTPSIIKYSIPHFLRKYKFNNLEKIAKISVPILVIHSPEDEVILYSHGQKLLEKANPQSSEFIEIKGSHNSGFLENFEDYKTTIKKFIQF